MKKSAGKLLCVLAVLLSLNSMVRANPNKDFYYPYDPNKSVISLTINPPYAYGNIGGMPEIYRTAPIGSSPDSSRNPKNLLPLLKTLPNDIHYRSHQELFIPASALRTEEIPFAMPIVDREPRGKYDMNEWEEQRFFSSNLYMDAAFYTTGVSGDKRFSQFEEGEYYELNYRYELFTSRNDFDTLSLTFDVTHTNNRSFFDRTFNLNHIAIESSTPNSRLILGHAYPHLSPFTVTQTIMGIYGEQRIGYTKLAGFGGYYANERDDLDNPRYTGGFRIAHARDQALEIGLNAVFTKDKRDNAASDNLTPELSNHVLSMDVRARPTDNIFVDAEIARSNTDFDKRDDTGSQSAGAYRLSGGYKTENFKAELGVENGETAFYTPLGESPRDERAYFAKVFYNLNKTFSTKISYRESRNNLENYARNTLVRKHPEIAVTVKPSEYYKDMFFDFSFIPYSERSENGNFTDRTMDIAKIAFRQRAGQMRYYMALTQTVDRDEIADINNRDIERMDLKLTWEINALNFIYGRYSLEQIDYIAANRNERTSICGIGGNATINDKMQLTADLFRENSNIAGIESLHDRLNLSLIREYNPSTSIILDLEGSRNSFETMADYRPEFDDYTAKLRFLKVF